MGENTLCKQNILAYEGYIGSIDVDVDAEVLYGRILGINDIISYSGANLPELKADFVTAVKEYVEHCEKHNKKPEKSCSGKILLRISPELHSKVAVSAKNSHASINSLIALAIEKFVTEVPCHV